MIIFGDGTRHTVAWSREPRNGTLAPLRYLFVDFDGQVRTFIAIRDQACARIRAPELEGQVTTSRRATILVDLGAL